MTTASADVLIVGAGPTGLLLAGDLALLAAGAAPAGRAGHVDVVRPANPAQPAVLVRPDGYIAWAADTADPTAVPPLPSALLGDS